MTYKRYQQLRSWSLDLHFPSASVGSTQGQHVRGTQEGLCVQKAGQGAGTTQTQPICAPLSYLDSLKIWLPSKLLLELSQR